MKTFNENILSGVHIGEHGFSAEAVIEEIKERVIKPGYNFVTIRTKARAGEIIPKEVYVSWARFLRENKIYFIFLYSMCLKGGVMKSSFTKDMIDSIKEEAGEYFLGDMFGELGSCFGAKSKGYGLGNHFTSPVQDHPDVKSAADAFCEVIGEYIAEDKELGIPYLSIVEPTAISKYIIKEGIDLPMLELMIANPDWMLPYIRGVSRAYGKTWGTYMAHEWYGGMRHSDILKRKRLFLGSRYAYLAGSRIFCIESGDEMITAYGQRHEADSPLCQEYRDMLDEINRLGASDKRDEAGPRVKLAFVNGRYDAYCGGWGGSSVFGQYEREEWGYSAAEWSYRFLGELGARRNWYDIENYGDEDLSSTPAYGTYDIVPIEAGLEALSKYEYLIFLGWNSMTDEDMDNLTEYVRGGGKLLMSLAHLNYSVKRDGEFIAPPADKMRALFGATLTGETLKTNAGVKFNGDTLIDGFLYPASLPFVSDPILSCGYTTYGLVNLEGATPIGRLSDGFSKDSRELPYVVIENKIGKGNVILDCSMDYPGAPAAYPLYRMLAHEMVTFSARTADVKVVGSDRLRYSVYEDGKIYLLNTDYDLPITVRITRAGKTDTYTLEPMELKIIEAE